MDNPDGDPPKKPKKTMAQRRREAKEAAPITRRLMETEARQREREWALALEQERAREEEQKQAKIKAVQEQRDYEMALAISTSTPTENPLLLPRKVQGKQGLKKGRDEKKNDNTVNSKSQPGDRNKKSIENKQTEEKTISHRLHCEGCGGTFVGTRNLKSHVKENPLCLKFWGDDLASLTQKVTAIFKRRRSSRHYYENRDEVLTSRKEDYWADSEKQCDRKRIHYKANQEKEQERKRVAYEENSEKERLRQSVVRLTRAETQTTLTDRLMFEKEGRYGPIFPCVCCGQLNWYFSMFIENHLDQLSHDFVDIQHVHEHIFLFRKQNRFFICRPCKIDLSNDKCPKMSVRNYLQCPWNDVPPHLLTINQVENSLVAGVTLFANLHNNTSGQIMQSKRITAVPVYENFQHDVLQSLPDESLMVKIIRGNNFNRPVYEGDVRPELIREVYQYLLSVGNTGYQTMSNTDITEFSTRLNQAGHVNVEDVSQYVVLPDGVYSPGQGNMPLWFLHLSSPYSKTMPVFFPTQTGDWDDPRRDPNRPISETEWIGHMLRSVHKQLVEFPLFPFTAAYRLDMKDMQSAYNSCCGYRQLSDGSFERSDVDGKRFVGTVKGSSEWYSKEKSDIEAKCNNLCNPTLFVSVSNTENWDVTLSTALSQDGVDVWHKNDERRMLTLLEGQIHPVEEEGQYFAHTAPTRLMEDDCPYHENCRRVPINMYLGNDAKIKLLSRNTYNVQRIFCQRVGSLLRNVIMSSSNGLDAVAYHFLKEFGHKSGQAHAHGLVWQKISEAQQGLLKMQDGMALNEMDIDAVCELADRTVTSSLNAVDLATAFPDLTGARSVEIVALAKLVQVHSCDTKCEMMNDTDGCLYHFPRLPTEHTIVCTPLDKNMGKDATWYLESQCRKIKVSVRSVLKKLKTNGGLTQTSLAQVLLEALGPVDDQGQDEEGRYPFKQNGLFPHYPPFTRRIQLMMQIGHPYPVMFALYNTALSIGTWHVHGEIVYQLLLKRSVSESYTVDYNPYLLECMRSNMEVRYVTHTPSLLVDYVTKAEHKPDIDKVIEDIRKAGGPVTGASVATHAQDYRKVSLPEAFFRIDTRLFLSNSNVKVVYVNTSFPTKRGTMYQLSSQGQIDLPEREGRFILVENTLTKYGKRPYDPMGIKLLSGQQYSMCYKQPKPSEIESAREKLGQFSDTMFAVVGGQDRDIPKANRMLPLSFQATDGTFRVLRKKPVVVDSTQFPPNNNHNRLYAELLLFRPWFNEQDDLGFACSNFAACSLMHETCTDQIRAVKEGCRKLLLDHV